LEEGRFELAVPPRWRAHQRVVLVDICDGDTDGAPATAADRGTQGRTRLGAGGKWIRTSSSARETRPYGSAYDPEAEIFGLSLLGCARSANALVFLDGAHIVRARCAAGNFQDGTF